MYNLINKQTGLTEFTGSYDECLNHAIKLMKEQGAVLSRREDYYLIEPIK